MTRLCGSGAEGGRNGAGACTTLADARGSRLGRDIGGCAKSAYANAFKPLRSTRSSSLSAVPLGVFSPISHFCTVDTLVLR